MLNLIFNHFDPGSAPKNQQKYGGPRCILIKRIDPHGAQVGLDGFGWPIRLHRHLSHVIGHDVHDQAHLTLKQKPWHKTAENRLI